MHFSGLTIGHDKGFTQQVLGKVILPTPDLVQGQCTAVSEGRCSQGLRPILAGHTLHIWAFLTQVPSFLSLSLSLFN